MNKYQKWYVAQIDLLMQRKGYAVFEDPDVRKIYNQYYYMSHKEKILAQHKKWYQANKYKKQRYNQRYYIAHRQELILYQSKRRRDKSKDRE